MILRPRSGAPRAGARGTPGVRQSSLSHTAFLVLPAAATRTGIVSTHFERSLVVHRRLWNRLPSKELPVAESCEFCNKKSAVGEKTFIAGTEITQSCFAIGRLQDAILGAPAITHGQDLASPAITG